MANGQRLTADSCSRSTSSSAYAYLITIGICVGIVRIFDAIFPTPCSLLPVPYSQIRCSLLPVPFAI
ncbi:MULTISPECIES: hypothetical protein [unclassified Moorena]|uniref:hypothetical protein n=1 Tax=unclassified Moorena TaxID=2683338 RepID=UPI0013B77F31|nr:MULTISPECIES: hypothetical protein [unclassified Moorena]NEQ14274.1 hypothetical protein [Moorena sp. SIO3E2]NEP34483.1 hypothetical protein [Moorena sp. SIO3B2]NEQ05913.1 hypothetical protein [Moorena sp. SIO4E2]NER91642.1 hypothetical protein [Moorena sp. SIO3A2]NES43027.1 hypothetical protein [Moorena sp. SIO2C4]